MADSPINHVTDLSQSAIMALGDFPRTCYYCQMSAKASVSDQSCDACNSLPDVEQLQALAYVIGKRLTPIQLASALEEWELICEAADWRLR